MIPRGWAVWVTVCAGISLPAVSRPAVAQGFETVVQSKGQVLSETGTTVRAMRHASDGSYYILTKVGNAIFKYGSDGKLQGQIPNAASGGAVIKYAADIDVDSEGNLFVADQGANAVLIFGNDGSLIASAPVNFPVAVAALPLHQFAVLTLRPRRLITIMDQDGRIVSSFGNLSDAGIDPANHGLLTLGKIAGDHSGHIYLGFTSLPTPLVRKYDRYGSATYSASIDNSAFGPISSPKEDRVQFSLNFTQMNFSNQFHASMTVGTSGSVRFATGMGMGLNGLFGGGLMRGGGPMMAGAPVMGGGGPMTGMGFGPMMGGGFGSANGSGGPPMGPMSMGAEVSGTGSLKDGLFHFRFGLGPNAGPPRGSKSPSGNAGPPPSDSSTESQFSVVSLQGSGFQSAPSTSDDYSSDSGILATFQSSSDSQNANIASSYSYGGSGFGIPGGDLSMGISPGMIQPGMFVGGGFGGGGFGGGLGGGRPPLGGSTMSQGQFGQDGNFSGPPTGFSPRGGGGGMDGSHFGPPGHFGPGMSNVVGTIRVNLDRSRDSQEKPQIISAIALDPDTEQLWVSIGNRLLAFDKDGQLVATSNIATPGAMTLRANALIVERNRILIATDSSGIISVEHPNIAPSSLALPVAMQSASRTPE